MFTTFNVRQIVLPGMLCSLLATTSGCGERPAGSGVSTDALTPLYAASTDNVELLKRLQAEGEDLDGQYPERYDWTPLMAAIYLRSTNATAYLLEQNVDLGKKSQFGTALMIAILRGDTNTGATILRKQLHQSTVSEDWSAISSELIENPMSNEWINLISEITRTNLTTQSSP